MKYKMTNVDKETLQIVVPDVNFYKGGNHGRIFHKKQISLKDCSYERARFKLYVWQEKKGREIWGDNRWPLIKEEGMPRFSSGNFGSHVKIDRRKVGPRATMYCRHPFKDLPNSRSFSFRAYGEETAIRLAEFACMLRRCYDAKTDLVLPLDIAMRLTDNRLEELFSDYYRVITNGFTDYILVNGDRP